MQLKKFSFLYPMHLWWVNRLSPFFVSLYRVSFTIFSFFPLNQKHMLFELHLFQFLFDWYKEFKHSFLCLLWKICMQSHYVSILSYMDTIKINVMGPKAYTDANMLSKCFTEAFKEIQDASMHHKLWNLNVPETWEF